MTGMDVERAAEHFDTKYRADPDPWRVATSWYERRKYALTLASLPREHYHAVWEPGCSIGVLTALLAGRADAVDASDTSRTAVRLATRRAGSLPGVTVRHSVLPDPPPRSRYDLVVMSEILYYLPDGARERALEVVERVLPSGDLVVVHWRHHPDDAWAAGADVNAQVRARPGWASTVRHEESDFVLDILTRG